MKDLQSKIQVASTQNVLRTRYGYTDLLSLKILIYNHIISFPPALHLYTKGLFD